MSTATEAVEELWVSKDEAAARMKVKPRQVEKRAQAGYIRKRYQPRKRHERTAHVEYSLADIEAMLNGTPNQHGEPVPPEVWSVVNAPPVATAIARRDNQADAWGALAAHLAKLSAAFPAPRREWPQWLTLDEAVEYWGQTKAKIAELVRAEQVYATGRGPATWRIQRASLDGYGSAAHQ